MIDIQVSEKEIKERIRFLTSAKCNHTPHMYIDITGDLIQGTLLARILYWFAEDKNKKSKVRIFKDDHFWIAKQRKDWWEEIRITERQYDKAIKELEKKGFIVLAKYKFNSMPTIHIRPDYDNINFATKEWENQLRKEIVEEYEAESHKVQNGNYTKCKTGVAQSVNLLTGITNTDYIQESTCNSFSNEKEKNCNSPDGENCNSDFPKREVQRGKKALKDYSAEDFEKAESRLPIRARDIAYDWTNDKDLANNIYNFFKYFLEKRKNYTRHFHYPLTDNALRKVLIAVTESVSIGRQDGYTDTYRVLVTNEDEDWKTIVDEYFNTDFSKSCDYSLVHFSSETILTNLMNHVGKHKWCESEAW